ncbi:MAG: hypothetical protein WCK89_06950 [bacterium]
MSERTPNIKLNLDLLRRSITAEIKTQRKALSHDDPMAATFLSCLASAEHQLKSAVDYWSNACTKAYRRSGATSHLFQEYGKTLVVTLRDTNEPVKGKDQNEVFANTMKSLGLKACFDACKKGSIYAVKARQELLVDNKPQTNKNIALVEKGVTYYVYTNLSANDKIKNLKLLALNLGCDIHASNE